MEDKHNIDIGNRPKGRPVHIMQLLEFYFSYQCYAGNF